MDFIETARKLIEIDSSPDNGTREIATYAAELCREAGLFVEIQEETHNGVEQANIIARPVEGRPAAEFLLQTHLDTCDPGNFALWTKTGANPFNGSIYLDTIYGLGAASTKLDFLCKLRAVSELQGPWKLPFVLVGTFGEELGMPGAVRLIRKKKISAKMALVGEPTLLRPVTAGKGFAGVEIEIPFSQEEKLFREQHDRGDGTTTQSRVFSGRAAHSSMPQLGESAILKMLDYLAKLPEGIAVMEIEGGTSYNTVPAQAVLEIDMIGNLKESISARISKIAATISEIEKSFAQYADPEFDVPEPSMNSGMIRTYEDFVKISGCVRLPPTVSDEVYEGWMAVLRATCEDIGAVFRVTDHKQPFRTSSDEPLVKICLEELAKIDPRPRQGKQTVAQSVATEANVLSRFGISCVVIGPGQGVGNSHAPNERVKIEELHEAVRFYKSVLERVCL